MNSHVCVMLVEDNPEYRGVIDLALQDRSDLELTSQFGTSEIALRSLHDPEFQPLPDIILLDLRLPGMDGLESIPHFRQAVPDAKIIILSQSDDRADVLRAIALGVSGYLLKSSSLDQITDGIQTVYGGGATLDPSVAKLILANVQSKWTLDGIALTLSEREIDILRLLAEGFVKKEIAKHLEIGYSTVDTHVCHIYKKLKVTNAPSAVDKAHRLGLFPSDEPGV